ncbi:MAG: Acyl carrier protein [Candidatus Jorgensenbacteria bacterium GW2011_GWA1_48_11]|uniref:Acyl carrier protein n=1 Tax=Candidatus Jorgensenbacteria bacterium GW2011_GWA1_48_11 TaxID=1618660 RepID=A0A0G1XAW3_9BACT|nr:MAG: Acyl carrier protein [Candidatus Jorgensenbacteria bacterium GW2011_GWA1_48_11]KKW11973.1 MAG: Acyl carrier protein [Candidatus Jorgensenbacteria bacterium GW2011_GWB1_49_9]
MRTFNEIVGEIFKISQDKIRDDMSSRDIPEWDSMNYLLFISELEKNFGLSFTMQEVITAEVLGDLRKVVEERGKKS